ncbi:MAG: nucleoside-diphosphate kinase [Chitinophagaceae bacterium]
MNNRTLTIIKPDAVQNGYIGKIIDDILGAKFKILELQMLTMTTLQAQQFYAIHQEKPFFKDLVTFMSSASLVVSVIEKDNAVADFRQLIGTTNPIYAAPNTLRKKYGTIPQRNAIHGSDSDENAILEYSFFFGKKYLSNSL